MNVHLIRSEELDQEAYWNVLDLLRQFPGELKFLPCEDPVVPKDVDTIVWKDDEEFDKKNKLTCSKSKQSFFERKFCQSNFSAEKSDRIFLC